ncbi:MAG: hypothetical protein E7263_07745 [Lachnospiraceae bacterium]|nr:hypothetical protein [Lachnospiraceae bacterium]
MAVFLYYNEQLVAIECFDNERRNLMKKIVKKILGYLMTLVLAMGMLSAVPVKAAELTDGSTKIKFDFDGPYTAIDHYVTQDGKTVKLIVNNQLYSYDIATEVFTIEKEFAVAKSILTDDATATTIEEGQDLVEVFINDDTGMLYYAYNKYYDAYSDDNIIYVVEYNLETGIVNREMNINQAILYSVGGDDVGRVFVSTYDHFQEEGYKYRVLVYSDYGMPLSEIERDIPVMEFVDFGNGYVYINTEGTGSYAEYMFNYKCVYDADEDTMSAILRQQVVWQNYNRAAEVIDDRYYVQCDGRINDMSSGGTSANLYNDLALGTNATAQCNAFFGANFVIENGYAYQLYSRNVVLCYDLTQLRVTVSVYNTDANVFGMVECNDGIMLLVTDDSTAAGDSTDREYYYQYVAFDDFDEGETIDVGEELGLMDRTKEEITKEFTECLISPEATVYESKGSSVAPYSPWLLTDSAKKSGINIMNYYRYLVGNNQMSGAVDDAWDIMGKAVVLNDIYGTYFVDGEYNYFDVSQPDDMSDEFYSDAEAVIESSYSTNIGVTKEKDVVDGYRSVLNGNDDGYQHIMLLASPYVQAAYGASDKSFVLASGGFGTNEMKVATTWPSAGYFPVEELEQGSSWTFYTDYYTACVRGNYVFCPTVEIVDMDTGVTYEPEVYDFGDEWVNFAPPEVDSYKDKAFKVIIKGYENEDAYVPVVFEYTIKFFSYQDVKLNIDGKEYTCDEYGELTAVNSAGSNTGDTEAPFIAPDIDVSYRTHIQTFGWEGTANDLSTWKSNGTMSGTSGKSKRLEGINLVVNPATTCEGLDLGIQYTTHCQTYGWLPWSADGDMNGTEGEAKRLEAIKIQLTGEHADLYDVYYRVHAQTYGWLGWAKNGAPAGTAGYAKRLEGIQIVVVKKGESFDQKMENITSARTEAFVAKEGSSPIVNHEATSNTNPVVPGAEDVNVAYRTHVQSFGWQAWKYNGQMSGTSGQAKRLEGINIELRNKDCSGDIVYTTHVQTYGWQGSETDQSKWFKNGQMAGTSGEAKRLEAICIDLTGEMAANYDIYYRVHAQTYGWLGWAKNGAPAGTAGYAKRLEGIQIVLVPKGEAAPGDYQGIKSARTEAYVEK